MTHRSIVLMCPFSVASFLCAVFLIMSVCQLAQLTALLLPHWFVQLHFLVLSLITACCISGVTRGLSAFSSSLHGTEKHPQVSFPIH